MTYTYKTIAIEVTTSGAWTQFKTVEATPADYTVPAGSQGQLGEYSVHNLSAADTVVWQIAISPDNTPTNVQLVAGNGIELEAEGFSEEDNARREIPEGWMLWAKATGTTPDVVFRAVIKETIL